MDRRTYDLLCQRVEFLELLYSSSRKTPASDSYITRLSSLNTRLETFITEKYPEIERIAKLLQTHGLWNDLGPRKVSSDLSLEQKTAHLISNYEWLLQLTNLMKSLESQNPDEILAKRFPVQVIEFKNTLEQVNKILQSPILAKQYAKLVAYSVTITETYMDLVCQYNRQVAALSKALTDWDRLVARKHSEQERKKHELTY